MLMGRGRGRSRARELQDSQEWGGETEAEILLRAELDQYSRTLQWLLDPSP